MTFDEVMASLKSHGNESTKNILKKHGAREPFFGVQVADLKKIQKKIKVNHALAMPLWASGNSDAMYLAGMIADPNAVTELELNKMAKEAYWYYLSEYAVAPLAAESPFGLKLALEWIERAEENIQAAGWVVLSHHVALLPDEAIDLELIQSLMERAAREVHLFQNRVAYTQNGFIIAAGTYCKSLFESAMDMGKKIGKVKVDMGETACKVPFIPDYLQKIKARGKVGVKSRKTKC
ncbi:DNA alkylation repair protein [Persicobacter diffluens]|uniref:DNA alkylation repair protein n=1 Tax=Persicobacter diffluens TaxID=981 RepID=A0AAN4VW74_9BACT|nr:hypothetical protein PEDI_09310 [Persicobacter diffluens]